MIETPRLILRKWHEEDAEIIAKINQDSKVTEFLLSGAISLENAKAFIISSNKHTNTHGLGWFAATLKNTKELIGFIGLNIPHFETEFTPCVEIGWRLASQHWGKGYAPEGANAMLKLGFERFALNEIVAFTAKNNTKSIRVMEKIGMKRDLKGDFYHPESSSDHKPRKYILHRISKEEFLQNKSNERIAS